MPLIQGRVTRTTYAEILMKVDKRLAGWKHDKLSLAGRVTLAKSVLRAIPAFAMQTVKLPVTLCDLIDKKIRNFIWGSNEIKRRVHLVAWEKICRDKSDGGLGFRSMRQQNEAFLMKLAWGVMTRTDALWVKVLRSKYGKGEWDNANFKSKGCLSYQWRGIVSVWDKTKEGTCWLLGNGKTVDFWHDTWLAPGMILSQLVEANVLMQTKDFKVQDFVTDSGNWNLDMMRDLPLSTKSLLRTIKAPHPMGVDDKLVWGLSTTGRFTMKSVYKGFGGGSDGDGALWKSIWNWPGPQRIRAFLWLTAHDALLCNAKRKQIGISDIDICHRFRGEIETPIHVVRDCPLAKDIWRQLVAPSKWRQFFGLDARLWRHMALRKNFGRKEFVDWKVCFGVTAWMLWKLRNAIAFNEDEIMKEAPLVTIRRHTNEALKAKLYCSQLRHM